MTRYLIPLTESLLFTLTHYLALGVLSLLAHLIGRKVTARVAYQTPLEAACFSIAVGLGVISFALFFLGLLHLLHPAFCVALIAAGFLWSHSVWRSWPARLRLLRLRDLLRFWWILPLLAVLLPFLVLPLYPATDWDATQYHLAVAKIYTRQHAVVFTPYLRYPVFPNTAQMLFAGALLLFDEVLAHQIQLLMLSTIVLALIAFGTRHFTIRAGVLGAAAVLGSPLMIFLGSTAYVDASLMLFVFLSCYAFWNWWETRSTSWLVLAGVFSGLAFGVKYSAAFFPLVFCLALLWRGRKERKVAPVFVLAGAALLTASPWLLRSIYYAGNPLFPFFEEFFTGIFGARQVDTEGFRGMGYASLWVGAGRSLRALLSLPWNFVFHQEVFLPEAPVSTFCFAFFPLTVVFAVLKSRIRWVLLLSIAYTIFWFYGYQFARYLVPAIPLLCLATAASVDLLLTGLARVISWAGSCVVTALLCGALLYPSWYYDARKVRWEGFVPTTKAERDSYLAARHPSYPVYKFLNDKVGIDYRVFALDDVKMTYFADGTFLGDAYGEARRSRVTAKMQSGEELFRELSEMSVGYLVVNYDVENFKLPQDAFFERHFRKVFSAKNAVLYELSK